jgi:hypothetical protein
MVKKVLFWCEESRYLSSSSGRQAGKVSSGGRWRENLCGEMGMDIFPSPSPHLRLSGTGYSALN